jgi:hypothetical protein
MKFAAQAIANRKYGELVVPYFLYGRGTLLQKTPLGVFRALLNVILKSFPAYLSELTVLFEDRQRRYGSYEKGRWIWAEKELQEFLSRVLTKGTRDHPVVIFVDALDEAGKDAARSLLAYFKDIMKDIEREEGQVKICLSSRHHPNLGVDMCPTISVEQRNDKDIRMVIRDRLQKIQPESKRQQIEKEILLKAQGGFQWAVLVCNRVIEENDNGTKAEKLLETLLTIPEALDELYTDILCGVRGSERHQTVKLFQWVLFAARPLSAQELRDALSIDKDMQCNTKTRNHSSWSDTLTEFERHVQHLSRGLIEFQDRDIWEKYEPDAEDADREAHLIHQSVADYLLEDFLIHLEHDQNGPQSPSAAGHFQISRSCLRYLTLEEVLEEAQLGPSKLWTRFQLVPYVVRFLFHHIQKVEQQGIVQSDLYSLLQLDRQSDMQRIASVWRRPGSFYTAYEPIAELLIGATPLHVLVALGSKSAFDEYLKRDNVQVDGRDDEGNTPFLLALLVDQQDMALALLNRSIEWRLQQSEGVEQSINDARATEQEKSYLVDVNARNNRDETPLTVALTHNTAQMIHKLLKAGAEPDDEAILLAGLRGQTAIVDLLLSHGASSISQTDMDSPRYWRLYKTVVGKLLTSRLPELRMRWNQVVGNER